MASVSPTTRRWLEIQGFCGLDGQTLAEAAPWLRLAFALCTLFAATGTLLASPTILWSLVPIAALGAVFPVHPFDLLYNYGLRYITRKPALPKRGPPSRFACGLGAVLLIATGWLFYSGAPLGGYILGGMLTFSGLLVSTIHVSIPSFIYRTIFGFPPQPGENEA